eukprot:4329544-Alexandrium_andersonii.AAC.1
MDALPWIVAQGPVGPEVAPVRVAMVAGAVALTGVPVVGADAVLQGMGLADEGGRAHQCLRLRIGTEGACWPGW